MTTQYGSDFAQLAGFTLANGVLLTGWTKNIVPGAYPHTYANKYPFALSNSRWKISFVTNNGSVETDVATSGFNANSMLFYNNDDSGNYDYAADYSFEVTGGLPNAEIDGWFWCAWWVYDDGANINIVQWTKKPSSPTTLTRTATSVSYAQIRADAISNGWSAAPAFSAPGLFTDIAVGLNTNSDDWIADHAYLRVYTGLAIEPSSASLLGISNSVAPDTSAWADWPLGYSGGADLSDVSGNSRALTTGGVIQEGQEGPLATAPPEPHYSTNPLTFPQTELPRNRFDKRVLRGGADLWDDIPTVLLEEYMEAASTGGSQFSDSASDASMADSGEDATFSVQLIALDAAAAANIQDASVVAGGVFVVDGSVLTDVQSGVLFATVIASDASSAGESASAVSGALVASVADVVGVSDATSASIQAAAAISNAAAAGDGSSAASAMAASIQNSVSSVDSSLGYMGASASATDAALAFDASIGAAIGGGAIVSELISPNDQSTALAIFSAGRLEPTTALDIASAMYAANASTSSASAASDGSVAANLVARSAADSVSASDTWSAIMAAILVCADQSVASDATSGTRSQQGEDAGAAAAGETQSGSAVMPASSSESVSAFDALTRTSVAPASAGDAAFSSETSTTGSFAAVSANEVSSVSDASIGASMVGATRTEFAAFTDAATASANFFASSIGSAPAFDAAFAVFVSPASAMDAAYSLALTDSFRVSLSAVTEPSAAADAASIFGAIASAISEALAATDSAFSIRAAGGQVLDVLISADAADFGVLLAANVEDQANVADTMSAMAGYLALITDAAHLVDVVFMQIPGVTPGQTFIVAAPSSVFAIEKPEDHPTMVSLRRPADQATTIGLLPAGGDNTIFNITPFGDQGSIWLLKSK